MNSMKPYCKVLMIFVAVYKRGLPVNSGFNWRWIFPYTGQALDRPNLHIHIY